MFFSFTRLIAQPGHVDHVRERSGETPSRGHITARSRRDREPVQVMTVSCKIRRSADAPFPDTPASHMLALSWKQLMTWYSHIIVFVGGCHSCSHIYLVLFKLTLKTTLLCTFTLSLLDVFWRLTRYNSTVFVFHYYLIALVTVLHRNPWTIGWMRKEQEERLPTQMKGAGCRVLTLALQLFAHCCHKAKEKSWAR